MEDITVHTQYETENLKGRGHLGDIFADGRTISKCIFIVQLVQDKNKWQAVV
jgi:hypothetical protein